MKNAVKLLRAATLVAISWAGAASANTIEGAINVDNDFIVVLSQPGNPINQTVYSGANGSQWGKTEQFKFDVNPDTLDQCSVNIIAWGDNSVAQGFAGVFRGDNGVVYTGGSGISAYATGIPSSGWAVTGGGPTQAQIDTIVAGNYSPNPHEISGTVTGGTSPWGALSYTGVNMSGVPASQFQWIWPQANQFTGQYSAFKIGCGDLVKKPAPVPVHMPGEHYQCYNLEKGDRLKPEPIQIRDQFGESEVVLGTPRMLCNPSEKRHNDRTFRMLNEKRHLVCYDYVKQEQTAARNLHINNQFAPDDVVATRRQMFCVPSSKEETDKIVAPKDTRYERGRPTRPAPRIQRR